jgi:hypothetical protein
MIDYDAISRKNERELGTKLKSRRTQISLYADPAHFVYELLQNADDRYAEKISFALFADRLVIEHNARERFTVKHVELISSFEDSGNENEPLATGKFGLGFKSVLAFTATPRVFCGDVNFEIYDLYRLRPLGKPRDLGPELTRFELPFNHRELKPAFVFEENLKSPETAFEIIRRKFSVLEDITLLFTRNLASIQISAAGENWSWCRKTNGDGTTTIEGGDSTAVFRLREREIKWEGKTQRPVQIAIRLDDDGLPMPSDARLVATFPTSISTGMGVILDGPFRTTPARETVGQDDEFNKFLIEQSADLLAEILREERDAKRLSLELLEMLPIGHPSSDAAGLFTAIHDKIRKMLVEEKVLPTAKGDYVAGNDARIARGQYLVELFSDEQLRAIMQSNRPLRWLSSDITETTRLYRALAGQSSWHSDTKGLVEAVVVRPELLFAKLNKEFLSEQEPTWLGKLYSKLNEDDVSNDAKNAAARRPIVRLSTSQHVPLLTDGRPSAYLPTNVPTKYPTVDPKVLRTVQARAYFTSNGYCEPGLSAEVFERLLPKYQKSEPKVAFKTHLQDLRKLLRVCADAGAAPGLLERLRESRVVHCFNAATQQRRFCLPTDAYFADAGLQNYFAGNSHAWFVAREYDDDKATAEIHDLFSKLGVCECPRELCQSGRYERHWHGSHEFGVAEFHPQWNLDGLDYATGNPTVARAAYIWNNLLPQFQNRVIGRVRSSTRQDFPANCTSERQCVSPGGELLRERPWMPDAFGEFLTAQQIQCVGRLHDSLDRNHDLLALLDDEVSATKAGAAITLGITRDEADFISEHRSDFERWRREFEARRANRELLDNIPDKDRERRRQKLLERKAIAPIKATAKKLRSVAAYSASEIDAESLFKFYRNDEDGRLFCQICLGTMPFQKRDRSEYSECVTLLTKPWADARRFPLKVMTALNLVLCPVCSSLYKEYVHKDHDVQGTVFNEITNGSVGEVTIACARVNSQERNRTIHFDPTHLADIRDLLKEAHD